MRAIMINDLKRIVNEADFDLEAFAKEFSISVRRANLLVEYVKTQPFDDTNSKGIVL